MSFRFTVFDSIRDNRTDLAVELKTWEEFEKMLVWLSNRPGYKARPKEKNPPMRPSPLLSPAVFKPGTTRANANVVEWGSWAAMDVDDAKENVSDPTSPFRDTYRNVCYSTASCTREKPKFRAVFPLTNPVPNEKIPHFWRAINTEMGGRNDEQTKDLSRMYYVPAIYPNAWNFIEFNDGPIMDPFAVMSKHPFVQRSGSSFLDKLESATRETVLRYRMEQATNKDVHWSSYRDCPFVNKKLVKEYSSIAALDGSGRYRMIYRIMTSIACEAVRRKYPITAKQVAALVRELDADTSGIYQQRPLEKEADRAIHYAYGAVSP